MCEIRKPRGETGSLQMKCCSKKKYARQEDEGKASTEFTFYDQYGMLRKGLVTDDGLAHNRGEFSFFVYLLTTDAGTS